jgi:hypothetical protein
MVEVVTHPKATTHTGEGERDRERERGKEGRGPHRRAQRLEQEMKAVATTTR